MKLIWDCNLFLILRQLGLVWGIQKDKLLVNLREFCEVSTWQQMASQLASQFDLLEMALSFILGARLILQKVLISGADWDDTLPLDVKDKWKKWLLLLNKFIAKYISYINKTEVSVKLKSV